MQNSTAELLLAIAVGVVVILIWQWARRRGLVSEPDARRLLRAGAKVVDVRTPAEFAHEHLPGAVNVPLTGVREGIRPVAPDPAQPLLLHCHSGGRSGIARILLRRAGYTQVHNLGSFGRARRLVTTTSTPGPDPG